MKYFLKEWSDNSVLVIDERGQVLGNFISVEDAVEAYDWVDAANDDEFSAAVDVSNIAI